MGGESIFVSYYLDASPGAFGRLLMRWWDEGVGSQWLHLKLFSIDQTRARTPDAIR
jgi:hypothetical protein